MSHIVGAVSSSADRRFELENLGPCAICTEPMLSSDEQNGLVVLHDDPAGRLHPIHKRCWSDMQRHPQVAGTCPSCRHGIDPDRVTRICSEKGAHQEVTGPKLTNTDGMGTQLAALDKQKQELCKKHDSQFMKEVAVIVAAVFVVVIGIALVHACHVVIVPWLVATIMTCMILCAAGIGLRRGLTDADYRKQEHQLQAQIMRIRTQPQQVVYERIPQAQQSPIAQNGLNKLHECVVA